MTYFRRVTGHPAIRSAASYAGVTTVVKAAAFLKEAVVAAVFGVSGAMDAYLMALVVIGFPVQLLTNSLNPVFVSDCQRILTGHGEAAARAFLWTSVRALLIVLAAMLVLWMLALPGVLGFVGHGLEPGQRTTVTLTVYGLTIYYFLTGLNLLGAAALQALKKFALGGIIPLVTPVAIMAIILVAGPSLRALVAALTAGTLLEVLLVYGQFVGGRTASSPVTLPLRRWLKDLARGTATLLPGTAVSGLVPVIEQTIASGLGKGAIASLGYAAKLPATINSLLVTAVGVTILPYFAEMLATGKLEQCRRFYKRYVLLLAAMGTLIGLACILLSEPFVRIAFERGAFSDRDTATVAFLQQAYLLQLPGALVAMLSLRLVAARGAYAALTAVNIVVVPIVGFLQWWLADSLGPAGVALGTSVGATLTAIIFVALALWITRGDRA